MELSKVRFKRFSQLAEASQRLLRLMQTISFGKIVFHVQGGEPDPDRPQRVVRTLKLSGRNGPQPQVVSPDFDLRAEHVALLERLAQLPDGSVVTLKVAQGLPTSFIDVEEDHRAA
jgi:hypothetical protein